MIFFSDANPIGQKKIVQWNAKYDSMESTFVRQMQQNLQYANKNKIFN